MRRAGRAGGTAAVLHGFALCSSAMRLGFECPVQWQRTAASGRAQGGCTPGAAGLNQTSSARERNKFFALQANAAAAWLVWAIIRACIMNILACMMRVRVLVDSPLGESRV